MKVQIIRKGKSCQNTKRAARSLERKYQKDLEKQSDNIDRAKSVFLQTKKSEERDNQNEFVDLFKKYGHLVDTNKFKYLGKVSNLQEEIDKKQKDEFVNISYKDYLNLKKNL